MKRVLLLPLLLVCSLTCFAQNGAATEVDDYIRAEMQAQQIPGVSLAVIKNGDIVLARGYGLANVEHQVPVKPETIFQSGSMGKQFTATAVMMLVEEGKLSLDDKITKFFTDAPEAWRNITVRHLLTHTSGMTDYPQDFDLRRDYTEDELYARIKPIPLAFQPGEKWSYSNLAYVMLGLLIHKVSGKFYGDFLQERVFQPLGMTTARVISEADIVPNRAAGYRVTNGQLKNQSWVSPSLNTTADGALYLTVYDMAKWDAALYTEKLLKRSSLEEMWTPVKLNDGKTHPYGFGWALASVRGHRVIEHGGSWQGFKAHIARFPDDKLTVVIFANQVRANPAKLAHRVAELFIDGVAVFAHAQTRPNKETSTVAGRVTIKDKPAPGIAVGLMLNETTRHNGVSHRAVTDTNGEYRITNVPAGTYEVTVVVPPGLILAEETFTSRTLIVSKGESVENVRIELIRSGVITGKIVDSDGRPLIEQQVTVFPEKLSGRNHHSPVVATTDDRGIYRAYGLPAGTYRVAAGTGEEEWVATRGQGASFKRIYYPDAPDVTQAKLIEVTEGSETKDINITLGRLLSTFTASGRIVDETGKPLEKVSYFVTYFIEPNRRSSLDTGALSNVDGEFKLEKLVPGQYAVGIRPLGNFEVRADEVRFEITDRDVRGLVITAKKAASVSGVIVVEGRDERTMHDQLSRYGLRVSIAGDVEQLSGFSRWSSPANDGSFRIGGLTSGSATFDIPSAAPFRILRVERDGVPQPRGVVEIREREQVTGIRIFASYASASIRGTIHVQNGILPPNAQFWMSLRKPGDATGEMTGPVNSAPQIDARGQFVIADVVPGTYELHTGLTIRSVRSNAPANSLDFFVTPAAVTQVTVTGGATTQVDVTIDLSIVKTRP